MAIKVIILLPFVLTSCEKAVLPESPNKAGNVTLTFSTTNQDATRANTMSMYISKLNVQLFDEDGQKVFSTVKTQTKDDEDFGTLSVELAAGIYTVVAVGHSSVKSATIKSPEVVQFTASDGEKLTDTFCHVSTIEVGEETSFSLPMYRATAMVQLHLTDESLPDNLWYIKAEYTGGSANVNPTTLQGITKSSQSERRITNDLHLHQYFTFPYMSASGTLKMTVTATTSDGTVLATKQLNNVPVYRNRITTYSGHLFDDTPGEYTVSDFSFIIHADWEGEDNYKF